ncbi:hypothetical protein [Miltoncostaea oceani]|jgi:hypothetical protein|uniref:hypothetical protein n=1 Tax=Miltoncostaea oceani TaxID=2843216 RepID=UPI001C3D85AB|nr:hypothetical protein [Miltoncostaea oceani]
MPESPERPGTGVEDPLVAPPLPGVDDDVDQDEELWIDDSGQDYSGWYCVRTDPWPCPAPGCTFVARFLTAAHLVIVWPEMDDPSLLRHAAAARDVGRNPRPDVYEPAFGPACSYYQWEAAGHPVHAVRGAGDGDVYSKR